MGMMGGINGRAIYSKSPTQHPDHGRDMFGNKNKIPFNVGDLGEDPLKHGKILCKICFTYKSTSGSCNC